MADSLNYPRYLSRQAPPPGADWPGENPNGRSASGPVGIETPGGSRKNSTKDSGKRSKAQGRGEASVRRETRERTFRRILTAVIVILIAVLIGELLFHLVISPRMALRNIQVEGNVDIGLEELKRAGGIYTGKQFYQIDEARVAANIEALPDIHSAAVRRIFPDGLRIQLSAREPMGILMVESAGVILPALVDREGVVYRIGLEIDRWDLPIIRGVEFDEFGPGAKVHHSYARMMDDIQMLHSTSPQLMRAFSEFCIEETYPGVYEWVLIPIHVPVRLRASAGLDSDRGLYMLKVLELMNRRGLDGIREIDFRTGDVVYSREGARDGQQ